MANSDTTSVPSATRFNVKRREAESPNILSVEFRSPPSCTLDSQANAISSPLIRPVNAIVRWPSALVQLKVIQEVITLVVFAAFSVLYLKEPFGWNHAVGFSLIALGAFFIFQKW